MKKIIIIIVVVVLALTGAFLLFWELDARKLPPLIVDVEPSQTEAQLPSIAPPATSTNEPPAAPEEAITEASTPPGELLPNTIHIRGKSYPYKTNIAESTLKDNIGWMDTSARPGDVGVCVVMGHRNKQLRCLKDVKRGDKIIIVDAGGVAHSYTVDSGEIVKDSNITFTATDMPVLALLTCYPFYFSGSAPHQYVVTAIGYTSNDPSAAEVH